MTVLERIQELCKEQGTNPSKLEIELNFGKGTLYKWDKSSPNTDKLTKVADYFKVSTDYLLYGFEKSRVLKLIDAARYDRTIEQFAYDVNIDFEYMRRLCGGDITEPPSEEYINKIMQDEISQILSDRIELMEAAGHWDRERVKEEQQYLALGYNSYVNKKHDLPYVRDNGSTYTATIAAHRTDGYDNDLPPEAQEELKNYIDYLKSKYKKKDNK